ncbi:hypothetical protein, partial [Nocardia cyriacigeorgica]|uniref:hypothetical protein n=1 Tax=Nocardia cyriacigeorgica TaxID=135487 RepID=UPI002454E4CF
MAWRPHGFIGVAGGGGGGGGGGRRGGGGGGEGGEEGKEVEKISRTTVAALEGADNPHTVGQADRGRGQHPHQTDPPNRA